MLTEDAAIARKEKNVEKKQTTTLSNAPRSPETVLRPVKNTVNTFNEARKNTRNFEHKFTK